mmetsp:Transcript_39011/g.71025  ORF Transcript_39011/g.71025 Transcript_39011/m.71025 type:complete len:762 (+) Transcript_39011:54-2339(+)
MAATRRLFAALVAFQGASCLADEIRHCVLSAWTEWTRCADDVKYRSRMISVPNTAGGIPCDGSLQEVQACSLQSGMLQNWSLSAWTAWSECSATCGGGQQMRMRTGKADGQSLQEARGCAAEPCSAPQDCQFSPWNDWSACKYGVRSRSRNIAAEAMRGGMPCRGSMMQQEGCHQTDCSMAEWSEWSSCSGDCGFGARFRERVLSLEVCRDLWDEYDSISTHEMQTCELEPCDAPKSDEVRACVPVDCVLSEWTEWSDCESGTAQHSRDFHLGNLCGRTCEGPIQETKACSCEMQSWSEWSTCSSTQDVRLRERDLKTLPCLAKTFGANLQEVDTCLGYKKVESRRLIEEGGRQWEEPSVDWEVVVVPGWSMDAASSHGIKAGGLLYTMGLTGTNMSSTRVEEGGIEAQTQRAMNNLQELLKSAGVTLSQVVTCSLQLADLADFATMNAIYSKSFPNEPPSRVAVAAKALEPSGALFEITCIAALTAQKEVVSVPGWPLPKGIPLSMATKVNGIVFASGMQGMNMTAGKIVPGGVRAETNQTMSNMKKVLEAAGSSMDRVLACEVSLADIKDFAAMNEVYKAYLPGTTGPLGGLPSRVAVQVTSLVGGSKVEIKCVAAAAEVSAKAFYVPGWPTVMPFSSATLAQGVVYAAGVQGYDMKSGTLAPGGAFSEGRQALANLAEELKVAGGRLDRTIACDLTAKSADQLAAVRIAVAAVWPKDPPALSTAVVAGLAGNGTMEIKCVGLAAAPPRPTTEVGIISV